MYNIHIQLNIYNIHILIVSYISPVYPHWIFLIISPIFFPIEWLILFKVRPQKLAKLTYNLLNW